MQEAPPQQEERMSQQDVDTIKGAYDAFARQDIDGVMAPLDDSIDWDVPTSVPWGGKYHGKEEVGGFFASLAEQLDELNVEPQELIDAGDRVIALGRHTGSVAGESFETRFAMVWTMRDGKAVAFAEYSDMAPIAKALEARVSS
jgi:ketosteroid isomerase-like protein